MYPKYKSTDKLVKNFKSLTLKKDQISDLMTNIIIKKNSQLRTYKNDIRSYINEKLNGTAIDSKSKEAIENDVVQIFTNKELESISSNAALGQSVTEIKASQKEKEHPESSSLPQIANSNTNQFNTNTNSAQHNPAGTPKQATPHSPKPTDLYNRITQMRVLEEREEQAKKQQDLAAKKLQQREELDQLISNKRAHSLTLQREHQIYQEADVDKNHRQQNLEASQRHLKNMRNVDEKQMRMKMLEEKVQDDQLKLQEEEAQNRMILEKAKRELIEEKQKQEQSKKVEKEKLLQIKSENEVKQKAWKKELAAQKQRDVEMQEEQLRNEVLKQQKREDEFKARLKNIQDKMDKMEDTVVKDDRHRQLQEEQRVVQLQIDKERQAIEDERQRKKRLLEQNRMINRTLVEQIDEKQTLKNEQRLADRRYKAKLEISNEEKELKDMRKREQHKNELLSNRDQILQQHEERKNMINREMNENEEKINKDYIQGLSRRNMI